MFRFIMISSAVLLVSTSAWQVANARRAMPPKTTICNQSKQDVKVATMTYAGQGNQRAAGWNKIAPNTCETFSNDKFHIQGSAKVTGLRNKHSKLGCIKEPADFAITRREIDDKDLCAADKGELVTFLSPTLIRGKRKHKQVVVK